MELPLGKPTTYNDQYDNNLLVSIPRSLGRKELNLQKESPFKGVDFWNCYEVSWLNTKGKPCVRVLKFEVAADSEFLIESKSLKLYLNSFNGTKFQSDDEIRDIIQKDLSATAKAEVKITISTLDVYNHKKISQFSGQSLDDLDVTIADYSVNSDLLKLSSGNEYVEETLFSDLLKSNCLITNQPDWASVQITYKGRKIDHESLLKYIISFRNHNEFHEQCVEHIFCDISEQCQPESLTIHAKYTRRGGIDINPFRTSLKSGSHNITNYRDIRQ